MDAGTAARLLPTVRPNRTDLHAVLVDLFEVAESVPILEPGLWATDRMLLI